MGVALPSAHADLLFSNPPLNNAASIISDFGTSPQREALDDFVLAGPNTTVGHIRWWGSYGDPLDPPTTDSFTVRFFNDLSGTPAATHFAEFLLSGVTRTTTSLNSSLVGIHDGGTVFQ
jgi:hypothetical protein